MSAVKTLVQKSTYDFFDWIAYYFYMQLILIEFFLFYILVKGAICILYLFQKLIIYRNFYFCIFWQTTTIFTLYAKKSYQMY